MRNIILSCLTFILFSCPVLAQEIKIPLKLEIQPGRLTKLEISYIGDDFSYEVSDGEIDVFREYNKDEQKVVLRVVVYAEGNYTLFAAAVKDKKLVTAKCDISTGKAPNPVPLPPDDPDVDVSFPDGQFNVARLAYKWAKDSKITSKGGTKVIAASFTSVAGKIASGNLKTPEDALKALKASNNQALANGGFDVKPWDSLFGPKLQTKFNELYDSKALNNDMNTWKVFFEEISLGLEKVK